MYVDTWCRYHNHSGLKMEIHLHHQHDKSGSCSILVYNPGVMVFNATFNNISFISWRSVLLVEETGENHRPAASH